MRWHRVLHSISNEMLQCFLESRPDILKKAFNTILRNPKSIEKWSISMINPLHKSGSKMNPDIYRGISLLSCFSKYFTAILNLRLTQYAIDSGIFSNLKVVESRDPLTVAWVNSDSCLSQLFVLTVVWVNLALLCAWPWIRNFLGFSRSIGIKKN